MLRHAVLAVGIALLSTPAFAVSYKPTGTKISLPQAVRLLMGQGKDSNIVFDHGKVFVELGKEDAPGRRWAEAKNLGTLETEVRKQSAVRSLHSDRTHWSIAWNRLEANGAVAFDTFEFLQEQSRFSMELERVDKVDELYRSVVRVYQDSIEPMSVVGPLGTVYRVSIVYSGGAHEYGSGKFDTYDAERRAPATLLNFVDHASLLRALKRDPYMKSVAKKFNKEREFAGAATLKDYATLARDTMQLSDLPVTWANEPMDQFEKFAIWDYDVSRGELLVRLGLEYNIEVNRGQFKQLGLRVKATPEAAAWLMRVKQSGQALFMKDVPKKKRP